MDSLPGSRDRSSQVPLWETPQSPLVHTCHQATCDYALPLSTTLARRVGLESERQTIASALNRALRVGLESSSKYERPSPQIAQGIGKARRQLQEQCMGFPEELKLAAVKAMQVAPP